MAQERKEFFKLCNLSIYTQTTCGRWCYKTTLKFWPVLLFVVTDEKICNVQNVLYEFKSSPTEKNIYIGPVCLRISVFA